MKYMELSQGLRTIVDDDCFDQFEGVKFYAKKSRSKTYALRNIGNGKFERLHNLIMCPPDGMVVDHINGDGLDNRKSNLRIVTRGMNTVHGMQHLKTSVHRNVQYKPLRGTWEVNIRVGQYRNEAEAKAAAESARATLGID